MVVLLDRPVRLGHDRMPWEDPRRNPGLWTPSQTHVWRSGTYTVPAEVSEERVRFTADKFKLKFGKSLELQGFEVLEMGEPERDITVFGVGITEPNRRKYIIWARIRRRPATQVIDVPDEDVPLYQDAGYTLVS